MALTIEQATSLANFVNSHDGGVDQPRAERFVCEGGFGLRIRSLDVCAATGESAITTDLVYSRQGALSVLGY